MPKLRTGLKKSDADVHSALNALADVDHAALAFRVVLCVCDAQALSGYDFCQQRNPATAVIQIQRVCFFVERLVIGAGAIDE
jgi:hypothetical protein